LMELIATLLRSDWTIALSTMDEQWSCITIASTNYSMTSKHNKILQNCQKKNSFFLRRRLLIRTI
jgi:hypothetical protein